MNLTALLKDPLGLELYPHHRKFVYLVMVAVVNYTWQMLLELPEAVLVLVGLAIRRLRAPYQLQFVREYLHLPPQRL